MKKSNEMAAVVAASEKVNSKVTANVETVENTAMSLDAEGCETPKKQQVFADVRKLFGFLSEDTNEIGDELLESNKGLKFSEIRKLVSVELKHRKDVNSRNDSIKFETVCETIQDSELINDFRLFVGNVENVATLKEKLINSDGKVILYHGCQSEDGEKFDSMTVTKKGLHRPYKDTVYYSLLDYSTSNLIRGFRNYVYYLNSLKRVNRQIANEHRFVERFKELAANLHKDFGYMPADFSKLLENI